MLETSLSLQTRSDQNEDAARIEWWGTYLRPDVLNFSSVGGLNVNQSRQNKVDARMRTTPPWLAHFSPRKVAPKSSALPLSGVT